MRILLIGIWDEDGEVKIFSKQNENETRDNGNVWYKAGASIIRENSLIVVIVCALKIV